MISRSEHLLTVPRALFYSLSLFFLPLPSRLNVDHHLPVSSSIVDPWTTLLAIIALVGSLGVTGLAMRHNSKLSKDEGGPSGPAGGGGDAG